MNYRLFRPNLVADSIKAKPKDVQALLLDAIERILQRPMEPAGFTVSRVRGLDPTDGDRLVIGASNGWYITYEVLGPLPPLMRERFVRIIDITGLGEYQPPL
jgi:hypothetical protein